MVYSDEIKELIELSDEITKYAKSNITKEDLSKLTNSLNQPVEQKASGTYADYYDINPEWKTLQDVIEARDLSYSQANVLKVAWTFNIGRHSGTDYKRDLEKALYFINRELKLLENKQC